MCTVKEMREEQGRIMQRVYRELDFETRKAIYARQQELLDQTAVNVTKGGAVRYYLPKNASKAVVENYLECTINAMYDVVGYCF